MAFYRLITLTGALLLLALSLHAQPTGPSQPVTLEHADSIVVRQEGGEEVQYLMGHVRGTQGVSNVSADQIVYYPSRNALTLTGNVHVVQPGTTMSAPRADYNGNTRIATASSGITIYDGDATIRANSGTYNMYQRSATFAGGVTMQDKQGSVRSTSAEYYSVEQKMLFHSGVHVESDSGTIDAREITYFRNTREALAQGSVVVIPKKRASRLTGEMMHDIPAIGYTVVTGNPKLVDIDTVKGKDGQPSTDTTIIRALKLEAYRGAHEEYVATDSVKLRRGTLESIATLARYLPNSDIIGLGSGRAPKSPKAADTISSAADTLPTTGGTPRITKPTDDSVSVSALQGYPVVWYEKSQLTGDTMTIGIANKHLQFIDANGNGFAITTGKAEGRFDQMAGDRLYLDLYQDTVRQVRAEREASSIYFGYDNDAPNGVNRTSGDTIRINFLNGQASTIKVFGRETPVEGEYFPEGLVTGGESSYRLQGFRLYKKPSELERMNGTLPAAQKIPQVTIPAVPEQSSPVGNSGPPPIR